MVLNTVLLARHGGTFDPYPYILLNLLLSMGAALQAPVIMMSHNRLSQMDRLNAAHYYEVNLKAELEILALHTKLDELRELGGIVGPETRANRAAEATARPLSECFRSLSLIASGRQRDALDLREIKYINVPEQEMPQAAPGGQGRFAVWRQ